jgi:hypothetical protein
MLVQSLFCTTPTDFPAYLSRANKLATSTNAQLFLLFVGAKRVETGTSWCGDCVRAEPFIEQALAAYTPPYVMLTCDVEREAYRRAEYEYRTHPLLYLR